jgi:hypothetical protein
MPVAVVAPMPLKNTGHAACSSQEASYVLSELCRASERHSVGFPSHLNRAS